MKQRSERVAELVRQSIGMGIVRAMPGQYLTITKVEVSDDLRHAHTWVSQSTHLNNSIQNLQKLLDENIKELQAQLARSLKTRFTPKLHLHIDDGNKYSDTIDEVLNNLN